MSQSIVEAAVRSFGVYKLIGWELFLMLSLMLKVQIWRDALVKTCVRYFLTNFYFSPNDSTSKIMEDVFYFI